MSDRRNITNQTRSDTGFTLVEMIIALVLSVIVGGIITGVVVNMFTSGSRASNRYQAQRIATQAIDQMTDDLRASRAPGRESDEIRSLDDLKDAILNPATGDPDVHDIKKATGTRLQFVAEVDRSNPGVECVDWDFESGELIRKITTYDDATQSCPANATLISQTTVMQKNTDKLDRWYEDGKMPFKYRLLMNQGVAGPNGYGHYWYNESLVDPDFPSCASKDIAPPDGGFNNLERDLITNLSIVIEPVYKGHDDAAKMTLPGTVSLNSRQNYEYKYAIGCSS